MGYVISLILLIVFVVFIIILRKRQTNEINNIRKITIKELTKQELEKLIKEQEKLESYYNSEKIRLEEEYKTKTEEIFSLNKNISALKENSRREIDRELLLYKKQQIEIIRLELNDNFDKLKDGLQKELDELRKLATEQQEEWLRERLAEKADFYRIVISEGDLADLKLIKSFEEQFHNKEILNRAAFDTFIKKPMNEMIKRVLGGRSPSGIYMITSLLTDEIYIGRAVSVDKRWQEHCKSCFNLGTIAHSTLHTRMAKEGIWNFSFQLLEEVPKDKLAEREKYWINFYQTKEYGMNEKAGG